MFVWQVRGRVIEPLRVCVLSGVALNVALSDEVKDV